MEELRHRPLEPRPLFGRLHFRFDPRDLLQANLVNLFRGQLERGELLDHGLVIHLAVGHRGRGERRPRLGQVLATHEREESLVSRGNDIADHRRRFATDRCLIGSGNGRWHLRERHGQWVGRVAFQVRLDRLVAPDDRHARHGEAARETGSHVDDLLLEVARHVAKAVQIRAIPGGGGEALAWRELGPEEGVAVERRFVDPEPHVVGERANRRAEDLCVYLLLRRELRERNAVQSRQRSSPVGQPRLLRRGIDLGKAIPRAPRQLLLTPVPLLCVQRTQPRVSGAGAALRLGRHRHEHEGGAEHQRSQRAAKNGFRHDNPRLCKPSWSRIGRRLSHDGRSSSTTSVRPRQERSGGRAISKQH